MKILTLTFSSSDIIIKATSFYFDRGIVDRVYPYTLFVRADMAELADALDLGSSGQPRAGSSPVIRIVECNSPAWLDCYEKVRNTIKDIEKRRKSW